MIFSKPVFQLWPEVPDKTLDWPSSAVSQSADGALTTWLVLVEHCKPCNCLNHVCLLVHDNDRRCPETCLLGHQVVKVHQNFVTNRLGDEGSGAASRDDTEQVVPAADHSAAVALDQLLQGDAHLLLHCARVVHVARDVEQLGAGVPGATHAGEPVSSPPADGRSHGDSLDVGHSGGTAEDTDVSGEWGLQAGLALLTLQASHQGNPRFLWHILCQLPCGQPDGLHHRLVDEVHPYSTTPSAREHPLRPHVLFHLPARRSLWPHWHCCGPLLWHSSGALHLQQLVAREPTLNQELLRSPQLHGRELHLLLHRRVHVHLPQAQLRPVLHNRRFPCHIPWAVLERVSPLLRPELRKESEDNRKHATHQ